MRDFYYERKLLCPRRYENLHIFKIISGLVVLSLFLARGPLSQREKEFPVANRIAASRYSLYFYFNCLPCWSGEK
jgi:hypothetical protein